MGTSLRSLTADQNQKGGGVGFYFKNGIKFQIKKSGVFLEKIFESIFAEVWANNNKKFIVGSVYRAGSHATMPPSDQFSQFLDLLNNSIDELSNNNADILIAGDFNIDVLKYSTCNNATLYVDSLFASGFVQSVIKPTRCSPTSVSCIDHFISNFPQNNYETCILTSKISDHFPVFFFKDDNKNPPKPNISISRDFSETNINKFSLRSGQFRGKKSLGPLEISLYL